MLLLMDLISALRKTSGGSTGKGQSNRTTFNGVELSEEEEPAFEKKD